MIFTNRTYDVLKWLTQLLLPALATLYFALSSIWGLPYGEEVVGTLAALAAFLGVILGLSTNQYKKGNVISDGTLQIDTNNPEKDIYRMDFEKDLHELRDRQTILLKVNRDANLTHEEHRL